MQIKSEHLRKHRVLTNTGWKYFDPRVSVMQMCCVSQCSYELLCCAYIYVDTKHQEKTSISPQWLHFLLNRTDSTALMLKRSLVWFNWNINSICQLKKLNNWLNLVVMALFGVHKITYLSFGFQPFFLEYLFSVFWTYFYFTALSSLR